MSKVSKVATLSKVSTLFKVTLAICPCPLCPKSHCQGVPVHNVQSHFDKVSTSTLTLWWWWCAHSCCTGDALMMRWWSVSSVPRNFTPGRDSSPIPGSRNFSGRDKPNIFIPGFFGNCSGFFGINFFDAISDYLDCILFAKVVPKGWNCLDSRFPYYFGPFCLVS